jgi:diguanylate cyclase (GGDEF)-like protein
LFTRRHFFERLERELQTARGFERPLSVLVIDLNGTKAINDAYGHKIGDSVIATFGRFLLEQARASDVPARIGGDEFAILLPDTAEPAATAAVNRILQALDKTDEFQEGQISIKLTASVAASGFPWGADSADEMIRKASEKANVQKAEMAATGVGDSGQNGAGR